MWEGIEAKRRCAETMLSLMERAVTPRRSLSAATGAVEASWDQDVFYATLDGFLSAASSVPELIRYCFGVDKFGDWKVRFAGLPVLEQDWRREFQHRYKAHYDGIRQSALLNARHLSVHRVGHAPVTVEVRSLRGTTYFGSPIQRVPISESGVPDDLAWMNVHLPLEPRHQDFKIGSDALFPACSSYLDRASQLINHAREIERQLGPIKLTANW